jgi:hypothetical protein
VDFPAFGFPASPKVIDIRKNRVCNDLNFLCKKILFGFASQNFRGGGRAVFSEKSLRDF